MLYFLLYIALEVFLFVTIGQQIGFLLMISVYLLVTILGLAICRKGLVRTVISHELWMQQMREQQDWEELSEEEFNSRVSIKFKDDHNRILYLTLAQIAFVVPGLITEVIALLLMMRALLFGQSSLQEGGFGAWLGRLVQKIVPFRIYSRYSDYDEEMYRRYGKSERDMAREAEEAAAKANAKVPQPNEKAGQSSVAEMKAKFQENKVIKEARFEEVDEEDTDVNEDDSTKNATSFEKNEQSQSRSTSDESIFRP